MIEANNIKTNLALGFWRRHSISYSIILHRKRFGYQIIILEGNINNGEVVNEFKIKFKSRRKKKK